MPPSGAGSRPRRGAPRGYSADAPPTPGPRRYHVLEDAPFELAQCFWKIFDTKCVEEDDASWRDALSSTALFLALSDHEPGVPDMMHRVLAAAGEKLDRLPLAKHLLKLFTTPEIVAYRRPRGKRRARRSWAPSRGRRQRFDDSSEMAFVSPPRFVRELSASRPRRRRDPSASQPRRRAVLSKNNARTSAQPRASAGARVPSGR